MVPISGDGRSSILVGPNGRIAGSVTWANSFRGRLRGVLGRAPLRDDEALVITPCRRVHTFGVGYRLDAIFCDDRFRVLYVETLAPGRLSKRVRRARSCIEINGGRAESCGIAPGVVLAFQEHPQAGEEHP